MAAVAGATAFTSYSGLAGLAEMSGWNDLLAKFLPITVDAYAMTATRVWLSPAKLKKKARDFARRSAIAAIVESIAGNALYHAANAHVLSITWPMVVGLSAVPPVTLGLITHLYHVANDTEPETKESTASPGPAIADPDAVNAAYPILGDASALALPTAPGSTPGALAGAPRSAPAAKASAPRQAPASPAPRAPRPAGGAQVARSWEEREAQLLPTVREINAREIAAGNGPASARKLAKELHVSQVNAGKLIKSLAADPSTSTAGQGPATPVADAAPGAQAPDWLASAVRAREQSQPAPHDAQPGAGMHPGARPDAPRSDGSGALGPVPPDVLPPQREAPVEHANGASIDTP
jgi:hypothetical protein